MKKVLPFLLTILCFEVVNAQENYEIQVYASPTMTKGFTMFELHSNYTFQGERKVINGVIPTYHSVHETLEITHGITDNFELGFYLFTNYSTGYGYRVVGTHLRPRFAAPAKWKLPVGLSLSAEIGYQRQQYSADTWSLELRPIVDRTFGKLYASVNPVLGFSLKSVTKQGSPAFAPNIKIAYLVAKTCNLGFEYYGDLGVLTHFESATAQVHALFLAADLYLDPRWEINLGPGWGLTHSTDGFVCKLLVGRRIDWHAHKKS